MENTSSYFNYIRDFSKIKILCIGDIMLDRFSYGKIERISPEAPVPVFFQEKTTQMLGGAGNVVANLYALGCNTTFLSIVGEDENASIISSMLKQINCHHHLIRDKSLSTTVKTRLVAGSSHVVRIDQEKVFEVNPFILPRIERGLETIIPNIDLVLLSDYDKGVFSSNVSQIVAKVCKKFGKHFIVDPKGDDYAKYAGALLIKPNLKEFLSVTKLKTTPTSVDFKLQVAEGAKRLFTKYNIKNLAITLGQHGMAFVSSEEPDNVTIMPTQAREVFDVSGAGDTSFAAIGACIAVGASINDAIRISNIAAGVAVSKIGTATVSAEELKTGIDTVKHGHVTIVKETLCNIDKKILSLPEAKKAVSNLQVQGKRIGFTNGCFDLLHIGHLNSFITAKKECDILVVGINSDESVKRYKGDKRPIQDENTRASIVAALQFVDFVIIFDEDTAVNLVTELQPFMIAKQGYNLEQWPEAHVVLSYGGRVVELPEIEGYSTTKTVDRMSAAV
ncbi:MAG: bifunctional heptose 7-phosphate kinase/heptose 1-phosphate adenyltransferase [Alphaproteobacteria bacterium]|nr:bifunctional heptose 7-phosphate kinase/heptose 1-phosphate adenyltransferase [Alphaproteobacteria bacterium]MCL2505784.1 bifunctional heptose 7-phosphate kinase/heptose 1-phosphate adenyltransferase [Alphaproteobacteria bacterium]